MLRCLWVADLSALDFSMRSEQELKSAYTVVCLSVSETVCSPYQYFSTWNTLFNFLWLTD